MMNWTRSKRRDGEEYWISVSDLMAGLMMVFLFIMIIYTLDSDEKLHITQELLMNGAQPNKKFISRSKMNLRMICRVGMRLLNAKP